MREVVIRLDLIAHACNGQLGLTRPYAYEYVYLQFRRICELVALGCLRLHGDLPAMQSNNVRREWNAEKIMRHLQKNYKYAFPQSVVIKRMDGKREIKANAKENALTYKEFKKLYAQCGEVLHRGSIRSLEEDDGVTKDDYAELIIWSNKIVDLMNEHLITRPDKKSFYLVSLRTEDEGPAGSLCTFDESGNMHMQTEKLDIKNLHSKQ